VNASVRDIIVRASARWIRGRGRRDAIAAGLLAALLSGCVTVSEEPRGERRQYSGVVGAGGERQVVRDAQGRATGRTYNKRVVAEVQPRGTIPYDNETLPVVSPDGRYIATQAGFAPELDTVLARPGASIPHTSRVEIYRLPSTGADPPELQAVVQDPVVLGRACSADGVLVEAPRPGGARWIGLAAWETGEITWLVQDNAAVAAFATFGPRGQLAWSTRPIEGGPFDLAVRRGGQEWRMTAGGGQWLMPSYTGDGDGLFALLLRGDRLDAVHMDASSEQRMRQSIRPTPLAVSGATLNTAYQTLVANQAMVNGPSHDGALTFFHPSQLRAAVWKPPASPVLLPEESFAAVVDRNDPQFVLVSTPDGLLRVRISDTYDRIELFSGVLVPRSTIANDRPYILLQTMTPNEIGILVMAMLSPDQSQW
jgi:hypothetical protein